MASSSRPSVATHLSGRHGVEVKVEGKAEAQFIISTLKMVEGINFPATVSINLGIIDLKRMEIKSTRVYNLLRFLETNDE